MRSCRYVVSLAGLLGLSLLQEALSGYRAAYYRKMTKATEAQALLTHPRRGPACHACTHVYNSVSLLQAMRPVLQC